MLARLLERAAVLWSMPLQESKGGATQKLNYGRGLRAATAIRYEAPVTRWDMGARFRPTLQDTERRGSAVIGSGAC